MTDAYERVAVQGVTLNKRTLAAFGTAQARGKEDHDWSIFQGSYNKGVGASAGTHDGGGAIDVSAFNWESRVHRLRAVGWAAWFRPAIPGLWGAHIHAVLIGDKEMSAGAALQVAQYKQGTDGLAGHGPDTFPFHPDGVKFDYPAYLEEQRRIAARAARAALALKRAIAALVRVRKNTDDPKAKAEIQQTIASLRNH